MAKKYFCLNIDDGLEQDKEIIKILKRAGMGATFNLNSGMFGDQQMIGYVGSLGVKDVALSSYKEGFHILHYGKSNRIPADEVRDVYTGFEIASHGWHHDNMKKAAPEVMRESIATDVKNLSKISDAPIKGFAYPYGAYTDETVDYLREQGICYARTVKSTDSYSKPTDLMHLPITAWHTSKKAMLKLEKFIAAELQDEDLFFLMFGHGYEFDFNTKESNWEKLKRICDMVTGKDEIVCCSTIEALEQMGLIKKEVQNENV